MTIPSLPDTRSDEQPQEFNNAPHIATFNNSSLEEQKHHAPTYNQLKPDVKPLKKRGRKPVDLV